MRIVSDILFFLFPQQCEVCGRLLSDGEKILCSACLLGLPRTNFQWETENPVAQLFWGRVEIHRATSWFFFSKGSDYQHLLHHLKYQGRGDIGIYLGKVFASELINSEFSTADQLMPVPLHPTKQRKRGYNQSMKICEGMKGILNIPLNDCTLIRSSNTSTQTRRNRFDRYLNMKDRFEVLEPGCVLGKKILLIDDVVTTGSTLEACAEVLIQAGCSKVMAATLAVA
jgi:ComF family protein